MNSITKSIFLLSFVFSASSNNLIENIPKYSDAFVAPILQVLDKSFNIMLIGANDSYSQYLFGNDEFIKQLSERGKMVLVNFEMYVEVQLYSAAHV